MSAQSGHIDQVSAHIASQSNRAQPYLLTTPRGNRTPVVGIASSANRAEGRSIRGQGSQALMRAGNDVNNDSEVQANRFMAAITGLSAKVEKEMLVMSDSLRQEIEAMSSKIDEKNIGQLSNQVDEQLPSVSNKYNQDFITLSNKLDQMHDELAENAGGTPGGSAAGAAPVLIAPAPPTLVWNLSPELKSRVDGLAYQSVALPNIAAYTKLESPNGAVLANSLFATIKREITSIPGTWATEQLPPLVNGVADVGATQRCCTTSRGPTPGDTVPCLKLLIHRVAKNCGGTAGDLDYEVYWIKAPLEIRLRIAYLRREAIRIFQSRRRGGAGGNIWARVDQQLHVLSVQGP